MSWTPRITRAVLGLAFAVTSAASAQDVDFAAWTVQQKEAFLRGAEVIDIEKLDVGITRSSRVRLRNAVGVEHDAHWQTVDVKVNEAWIGGRRYRDFRDSYVYNVAAYRLDRLLGLDMVPVTVLRRLKGRGEGAALAWWVDDVLMTEQERSEKGRAPPRLLETPRVITVDDALLKAMRELETPALPKAMRHLLSDGELSALVRRRDRLVEHLSRAGD